MVVTGPTPPGTGVMALTTGRKRGEVSIAHQPVGGGVDAAVDHHRRAVDHLGSDQAGLTGGHHQDLGPPGLARQVAGATVGDLDGGIGPQQEGSDRASDHGRAADHDRALAGDRNLVGAQDGHHRQRGRGNEGSVAARQAPGVERRGAIHILVRVDQLEHRRRVEVDGHGLGYNDAGDVRVAVERANARRQVGELHALRWHDLEGLDAHAPCRARQAGGVHRRRAALVEAHNGQARPACRRHPPAPGRGRIARATGARPPPGRPGSSRSRRHDPPVDDGQGGGFDVRSLPLQPVSICRGRLAQG